MVRGVTEIVATAVALPDLPFARYELYLSQAGVENWVLLFTGERPAWQEAIYHWDTTELPDGLYDLRLRVVFKDTGFKSDVVKTNAVQILKLAGIEDVKSL